MRLLLDTHALLWAVSGDAALSRKAAAAIADLENEIYVSAASVWEIATKFRNGKLPNADPFVHAMAESLQRLGFRGLPISLEHAGRAGLLPGEHRDPFDRMLVAQAQAEDLVLVSNERVFDEWKVRRLW